MDPQATGPQPNAQSPVPSGPVGPDAQPAGHGPQPNSPARGGTDAADPGDGRTARRQFLRWLSGLTIVSTGGMILTPIIGFLVPTPSAGVGNGGKVLVATTDEIPAGGGKVVAMGSKPAVVVNTDQGVKAYSAICTHLGCVVSWNSLQNEIVCPCHGGTFDPTTGSVVSGPPPSGLPPITVSVEGNQIFLTES